jgi:hypothetical protein
MCDHDARDDGAAREASRVLRKNSNNRSAGQLCRDGFIAETESAAAHFSWRENYFNDCIA